MVLSILNALLGYYENFVQGVIFKKHCESLINWLGGYYERHDKGSCMVIKQRPKNDIIKKLKSTKEEVQHGLKCQTPKNLLQLWQIW